MLASSWYCAACCPKRKTQFRAADLQARPLTVEDDIRPVVDYLRSEGLQKEQIVKVFKGHPPILSYSADERLKPLFDYLGSIGFADRNDVRSKPL